MVIKDILRSKAGAEAGVTVKRFDVAISEFAWEQVPLADTQRALGEAIHLANDRKFSNIYEEFLNAPLGPRKDWELVRAAPFIALQADSYWKDSPEKVLQLATSLQDKGDNYAESGRARTMDLAASETTGKLTELLSQYYELYDQSEAERLSFFTMAAVNLGRPASLSQSPISRDDASEILGSISMAAFLCLLIPQLAANYKLKSADSLSMAFLFIWLLGDVTNLLGGLANGIAPASIAVTTYLCFSYSTLICQCLYYNSKRRIQNFVQPGTPRSQSPERRPLLEPADSSEDVNSTGHYQIASPGSNQVVDKDEETDISTVRTLHDWRFNAACLAMVAVLGISGWFVLRQFGLLGDESPPGAVSVTELPGISESVGSALGVIGAICYLWSGFTRVYKSQ
ncbi:uncharacterized protein CLUP02_09680 [Colletotrichum lupini]|uniref:Uncharacterized protein n=1 Tax=Colletotrichum lupini TaxID=145971 RepID=A0A9Q8SVC2_9PEZI|nr:uncharacterized protein CLUP02_09680 [Colletotrichum lupini]UQC84184.1 hypothetical protein CLUP02_09680 [Colletotrichum lupini]